STTTRTVSLTILEPTRIMSLLHRNNNSDLSLTKFFKSTIPKYTILLYRWGGEEVIIADLMHSTTKDKASYRKIQFYREQVRYNS
ncbi:hypothetical protein F5882DRAFT_287587, partial [Hyaloscypha sp. PMI_1271]